MAGSAELITGKLKVSRSGRLEPDPPDRASGDTILIEAELRDKEGVNHVTGMEEQVHGATYGNNQFGREDILCSQRILWIGSPVVGIRHLSDINGG